MAAGRPQRSPLRGEVPALPHRRAATVVRRRQGHQHRVSEDRQVLDPREPAAEGGGDGQLDRDGGAVAVEVPPCASVRRHSGPPEQRAPPDLDGGPGRRDAVSHHRGKEQEAQRRVIPVQAQLSRVPEPAGQAAGPHREHPQHPDLQDRQRAVRRGVPGGGGAQPEVAVGRGAGAVHRLHGQHGQRRPGAALRPGERARGRGGVRQLPLPPDVVPRLPRKMVRTSKRSRYLDKGSSLVQF